MPGNAPRLPAWPVVAALVILSGLVPARVAADSSASLRSRASDLQRQNAGLAARSHSAVLELYALDAKLSRERAHIVALRIQAAEVRAAQAAAERRLEIARGSLRASQRTLGLRMQQLYEQGDDDPVAVVLGASSVSEAFNRLDTAGRVSDVDRLVLEQTKEAKRLYTRQAHQLAARQQTLSSLLADAASTATALEQQRAQRAAYLRSLAGQRQLNTAAIADLEQRAQTIETRSQRLTPPSAAQADTGSGGLTLTVTATGYSGSGRTATGVPVGWGVVAVDPGVIALGTRMSVPGYGEGIAADTGGAIVGNTIDLWFPTVAQARAWGRRAVTITLH